MPHARDRDGALRQITWEDAEGVLASRIRDARARGANRMAWLGGLTNGSIDTLIDTWLLAMGSNRRIVYEPFDYEPLRTASAMAFGRSEVPRYDFTRARYVVSFGAEFLETWISNVEFMSAYAQIRRNAIGQDGTFTWVAPRRSLTGLNSDVWLEARPGSEALVALATADSIIAQGLARPPAGVDIAPLRPMLAGFSADRVRAATDVDPSAIQLVARRLASATPSLAVGGSSAEGTQYAVELELAVLLLNALAGNIGTTVTYGAGYAYDRLSTREQVSELIRAMADGQIDVLLVHGSNPALTLPGSSHFPDVIRRVPFVVSFANIPDETTEHAHLVLPDHHFLESWGDYAPRSGVLNLMQPAAAPLRYSRATGDVLIEVARQVDADTARAIGNNLNWGDYVRAQWLSQGATTGNTEEQSLAWLGDVRAGGRIEETPAEPTPALGDLTNAFEHLTAEPAAPSDAVTLVAYPTSQFYDGRTANEPWLRELPDPVTKIVWRSWVEVHPDLAHRLGVGEGDLVEIDSSQGRMTIAAHLSRGLRADVVALPIAAAREHGSWRTGPVQLRRAPGQRRIIRLEAAPDDPRGFAYDKAEHPSTGMYPAHAHPQHRWGMAIDLNTCTGCSACVVACYAENNVPVVGEEMCAQGREMSWMRIERSDESFLPMLCQQCDQAPCESVCPVDATYHNPEGLNAQVYARCIGTRFCSNNCPYKVRRFNFRQPSWPPPLDRQLNPDVTVRSAGVMEKCTFCVQRIQAGKMDARREGRPLRDGDITPACAQTCAAEAIVFGDLHDPNSRVSQLARDARAFHVLEELNTHPAITYLRRSNAGTRDES